MIKYLFKPKLYLMLLIFCTQVLLVLCKHIHVKVLLFKIYHIQHVGFRGVPCLIRLCSLSFPVVSRCLERSAVLGHRFDSHIGSQQKMKVTLKLSRFHHFYFSVHSLTCSEERWLSIYSSCLKKKTDVLEFTRKTNRLFVSFQIKG